MSEIITEGARKMGPVQESTEKTKKRKGFFRVLLSSIVHFFLLIFHAVYRIIWGLGIVSWASTKKYIGFINEVSSERKFFITKSLTWVMVIFTPVVILLTPVGFVAVIASILIVIDQVAYPINTVEKAFTLNENSQLSVDEKGALIFQAAHTQIERELNSVLGWCPNDLPLLPTAFLDNRRNRQLGVQYATREILAVLSDRVTKFGLGDEENRNTVLARQNVSFGPEEWGYYDISNSERYYYEAVDSLKEYELIARKSASAEMANIRTDDLVAILDSIKNKVLGEPYGRLTTRSGKVEWYKLDDIVYYSQGAAIVARDVLVAIRSTFHNELAKGGMDNLNAAIDSLEAVVVFNPWWVMRGDKDSLFADHRSKVSRYYTEAFRRIEDLIESVKM